MYKPIIMAMVVSAVASSAGAEDIKVNRFEYFGPVVVPATPSFGRPSPVASKTPLDITINPKAGQRTITIESNAPGCDDGTAVHSLAFDFENRDFARAELVVEGLEEYTVMLEGNKISDYKLSLSPATHHVEIRYASKPGASQPLNVKLVAEEDGKIALVSDGTRMFTLDDVIYGARINGASISPSGRYVLEAVSDASNNGSSTRMIKLYDLKNGGAPRLISGNVAWMPKSDKFYAERKDHEHKRHIVVTDPATNEETIFAEDLPDGNYYIGPTEEYLVYRLQREGQKEDPDAYQILEPDDRQPGWRDRSYPAIYRNGVLMPLTSGVDNARLLDITDDGTTALVMTSHSRLTKRPTTVSSLVTIDLSTLAVDTLVAEDGFLSTALFSPDGRQVLVKASPEAFDRIGCVLPESVTPSLIQQELFMIDRATKKVTPMSRDFDPNPEDVEWSRADGNIYLRAENRDMLTLYSLNPKTGKFTEIDFPENIVKGFSLSRTSPAIAVWAQSDSNPDRLYSYDTKTKKTAVLDDPSASRLANVRLAKCEDWNFKNSKGDTIYGRFYLPDNFDPSKKYPLIVNYYGGCSPTERAFETRYPWHVYAELGYVVYVVQPSGATGFGQEFSSRHVSTAGQGVADDIIEGTKKFCAEHAYVDPTKIGCIGASYGGFMTMYLQTVTDIFAAAISHAGISDHTSYWGEGYWGYSYSEASMGYDYPWSSPELYVKQSPLYNAHKVHTPLLFVHGDSDNNVPVGESIQMFTALKLLGRETALVQIKDQDHHILDPVKRQKWQNTIFAWFEKHLKDDATWWNAIYPAQDY